MTTKAAQTTAPKTDDGLTPARRAALAAEQSSKVPTAAIAAARAAPAPAPRPVNLDHDGCHNCAAWLARTHINAMEPVGSCRRYPPAAGSAMRPGEFPLTKASTWCGEHKPA